LAMGPCSRMRRCFSVSIFLTMPSPLASTDCADGVDCAAGACWP
jgi:hypothetical protein